MPMTLTSDNPTVSAVTTFTLTISYTVPHPATFSLQIDIPSDTSFMISNISCSSNCLVSSTIANGSQLTLTITNPNPNSTSLFTETYSIGAFKNRRFVGIGSPVNITTYVASISNVITISSSSVDVTAPNILTG